LYQYFEEMKNTFLFTAVIILISINACQTDSPATEESPGTDDITEQLSKQEHVTERPMEY